MPVSDRLLALNNGILKRSPELEETVSGPAATLFGGFRENECRMLAYDLENAIPEHYLHLDRVIPYLFGKKRVQKILNTVWLIETSLHPHQVKTELAEDFPPNSKVTVAVIRRQDLAHSGLSPESVAWLSETAPA